MQKVLKQMGKHKFMFLLMLCLMALQAYCDLSLPNYTANIVDIGIAQKGIENAVPNKIRAESMDKLLGIAAALGEDTNSVSENYIKDGGYYTLKPNLPKETTAVTEEILEIPMLLTLDYKKHDFNIDNMNPDNIGGSEDETSSVLAAVTGGDSSDSVYTGNKDMLTAIKDKIPETMLKQLSVYWVQDEYEAMGTDLAAMSNSYVWSHGLQMLLRALMSCAATVLVTLVAARTGAAFAKDLRNEVFEKVLSFSNKEYNKFSIASLITRCTNDIQQVQQVFIMVMRMAVYAPIVGISAFIKVLNSEASMSWIIGVAILAVLALVSALFIVAMPKFQTVQKLVDKINLTAREILTGLPVIRAFSREQFERERFDGANRELTKLNMFVNRAMALMFPTMMFIMNATSVLIIWVGAHKVAEGVTQVGGLMAFISYTMQIIMSFLMLSMMSVILPRAIISLRRVGEILTTVPSINDPVTAKPFTAKGTLEFKDVYFRYDGAEYDALEGISFVSGAGETTAIIGSTGCGKSTLVNLIPRFCDVTRGEILVNGVNIKDVSQRDLRDKVGFVPQRAVLFSGTIESNIKYSGGVDDDMMHTAAEIAQAEEFINSEEDKYKRHISESGGNVSGGQKQRLSIARAIAKNPEIYVFDDSFSALDYKTDVTLRGALANHVKKATATTIIVAQRISTVLHADRIVVLEDGKVAGIGSHKELLKNCDVYRDIAYSQLSAEQLEEGGVANG